MPYPYSFPQINPGDPLTASSTNAMHQAHVDNNIPTSIDDYSYGASQMREVASPGDDGTESYPTDLAGELTRLRHEILWIKQQLAATTPAYWYSKRSLDKPLLRDGTLDMTGKLLAKSGAAAPSNTNNCGVVFQGDNDSGLFSPSDGNLRLAVNGADYVALVAATNEVQLLKGRLKFPATQNPSTDANVLDDYEEGTWTPSFDRETTSPSLTYSLRTGQYIKVGRVVHASYRINISAITSQGSGNLLVTGLPFPITNSEVVGSTVLTWVDSANTGKTFIAAARFTTNILFKAHSGYTYTGDLTSGITYVGGITYYTDT